MCLACAPGDLIPSVKEFFVDLADSKWRSKLFFGGEESEIVYILRDGASGEYLKVGKTTVTEIFGRFGQYTTAGNKWGRKLVVQCWRYAARAGESAEEFEAGVRATLEGAGEKLPWDNTPVSGRGPRLNRSGQGIPMPKEQSETEFIDEVEQLRVKHAPPNIPARRGTSSKQKAKKAAAEKAEQSTEKAVTEATPEVQQTAEKASSKATVKVEQVAAEAAPEVIPVPGASPAEAPHVSAPAPAAPEVIPVPGASPAEAHQGTTMPRPKSAMPARQSPMEAHQGTTMPRPKSAMPARQSPMEAHQGTTMPKSKLGISSAEGEVRAPAVENAALVEGAVLGGLMENLILGTVLDLLMFGILGPEKDPVDPNQIDEAFKAVTPEIEAVLRRRGVGEHPSGEFASLLQRTKGGQIIYANISLNILPPVLRTGYAIAGQDPFLMRTEMRLTGVNLSTTKLATKEPLEISVIDDPARREVVSRVISIPIYDPNAIAPELVAKGDIV